MTKTTHYNLNKPEAGDPIRVADFNQNSDIIDTALAGCAKIVTGSYIGDGTETRVIALGFTPKAVYLCSSFGTTNHGTNSGYYYGGFALPGQPVHGTYSDVDYIALEIVEGGFRVAYRWSNVNSEPKLYTNSAELTYHYIVFR